MLASRSRFCPRLRSSVAIQQDLGIRSPTAPTSTFTYSLLSLLFRISSAYRASGIDFRSRLIMWGGDYFFLFTFTEANLQVPPGLLRYDSLARRGTFLRRPSTFTFITFLSPANVSVYRPSLLQRNSSIVQSLCSEAIRATKKTDKGKTNDLISV